jgi:outer membrane receptor for ferrienterochelin and colicin
MNEEISPTAAQWAPTYAQTYVLSMQGYFPGIPAGDPAAAHDFARSIADGSRPAVGSPEFNTLVEKVRGQLFQRNPPGASFYDKSRLYHGEFMYNFDTQIDWADIQVGGNYRQYDLFSDGTIFNEAPDDGTNFQRIKINEFGGYLQIAKTLAEKFRLTASMRFDKNENFDGQVTPRISALYSLNDKNHIRASFQTGFRNPDTQAQFIYFPSSSGTLLGSTEANAARYGVHNGGAWTYDSYLAYRGSGGSLATDGTPTGGIPSLLVTADIPYVQPEKLTAYELGYKFGGQNLFVDVNGYYTQYSDFIGGQIVALKNPTTHQGNPVNPGALYSLYNNSTEDVTSYGAGLGFGYSLPWKKLIINGSYNYAKYDANESADFRAGFNTPENKFSVGLSSREVVKNLGFALSFRYQQEFLWQSSYGVWNVPEFGVFDAQINYKISSLKSVVKIGGTNLGGTDYRTNIGSPFIGSTYYISLTFDQFTK